MPQHEKLKDVISKLNVKDKFAIFMHDEPDPDSMASALLLEYIIQKINGDIETNIYYTHKPDFLINRALISTLNLPLIDTNNMSLEEELEEKQKVGIVDIPNLENLTNSGNLDIIIDIDHHKERKVTKKPNRFFHYEHTGACSSILLNFIKKYNFKLDKEKHKAIIMSSYLGIKVDTENFKEELMTEKDNAAKAYLESLLDKKYKEIIEKIENTPVPSSWTQKLEEIEAPLLYKGMGIVDDSGMIPYISNELMKTGHFKTVIIYGLVYELAEKNYTELAIRASGRSIDESVNLNEAFGTIFHKKTTEGKKIKLGGGRKPVGSNISVAGARMDLMEYKETDKEGLAKLYDFYEHIVNQRIENEFKISSD